MTEPAPTYDPNVPPPAVDPQLAVDPQVAGGAWVLPPTQGLPALGTNDAAACTALFNQLVPLGKAAMVTYILSHSPAAYQDVMITNISTLTVP